MNQLMVLKGRVTRRRALVGVLGLLLMASLVAAACGGDSSPDLAQPTATPDVTPTAASGSEPTATPAQGATEPTPTAEPSAPQPTATPGSTAPSPTPSVPASGLRPREDWTEESPATREEIAAELEKFRGDQLVFVSWGGAYQSAQSRAQLMPFEERFGIDIIEVSPVEYSKIRTMAETGTVTWHVVDVGQRAAYQLGAPGLLEELDFSIIDHRDIIAPVKDAPWSGGGAITSSNVVAYNTDVYPEGTITSMSDFFDVNKFPGRRGVRDNAHFNVRMGILGINPDWIDDPDKRLLLAAPTEDLVDQSFAFWEEFKPNIDVFWHEGSECPQLLISGELDMCTALNGRISDAQKVGAPIAICWECGHLISTDSWVIPKGLAEQDPDKFYLAQLFLAWNTFPEVMVNHSKYISYGPTNLKALPLLEAPEFDEVRDELPSSSANIRFAILEDEEFTGSKIDEWQVRWLALMQE